MPKAIWKWILFLTINSFFIKNSMQDGDTGPGEIFSGFSFSDLLNVGGASNLESAFKQLCYGLNSGQSDICDALATALLEGNGDDCVADLFSSTISRKKRSVVESSSVSPDAGSGDDGSFLVTGVTEMVTVVVTNSHTSTSISSHPNSSPSPSGAVEDGHSTSATITGSSETLPATTSYPDFFQFCNSAGFDKLAVEVSENFYNSTTISFCSNSKSLVCADFLSVLGSNRTFLDVLNDFKEEIALSTEEYLCSSSINSSISGANNLGYVLTGYPTLDYVCGTHMNVTNSTVIKANILASVKKVFSTTSKCQQVIQAMDDYFTVINYPDLIYNYTGFSDLDSLCLSIVTAMEGENADAICQTVIDCTGDCGGTAAADCMDICSGPFEEDCAGTCDGTATTNECDECVGGVTGRSSDFGQDDCGVCTSAANYRNLKDCNGDCNGTAFRDECDDCVGGLTNLTEDANSARIDCQGICDGLSVNDSCGYCELNAESNTSKYWDCNSDCIVPGSSDGAYVNHCDECVGGSTGFGESYGEDDCGNCAPEIGTNLLDCLGCDGVANSGLVLDACGVCGGDGSTCVAIAELIPSVIPENTAIEEVFVLGAGFSESSVMNCLFYDNEENQVATENRVKYYNVTTITCLFPSLQSNYYTVKIEKDGIIGEINTTIYVYSELTKIMDISPLEMDLDTDEDTYNVNITLNNTEFNDYGSKGFGAYLRLLTTDTQYYSLSEEFTSDSELSFNVAMPANSLNGSVRVSINGGHHWLVHNSDDIESPLTIYAVAPNLASIKFNDIGNQLIVTFDSGVESEDFDGLCSDIFTNITGLGVGPSCIFRDPQTLYITIGSGDSLIEIGDTLTLKADAVKAFQETYSRSTSGTASVLSPDNPITPTADISGPKQMSVCGSASLSGLNSYGSGGRALTYTWSVSSDAASTTNAETITTTANADGNGKSVLEVTADDLDTGGTYEFCLTVENFLGESNSVCHELYKSDKASVEISIKAEGVDPASVPVSKSFKILADASFPSCVDTGTVNFEWTTDNAEAELNLATKYSSSLYVDKNSLPGGVTILFTVEVYKQGELENAVQGSIILNTERTPLEAIISGGGERTVGRDSGTVEFEGDQSNDPDNAGYDLIYSWSCRQTTDASNCWSAKTLGSLIPFNSGSSISSFDAQHFQAGKDYQFTMTVRTSDGRSAQATTTVNAQDGQPPMPSITLMTPSFAVGSSDLVWMFGTILHTLPLSSVEWRTANTGQGYKYTDLQDSNNYYYPSNQYYTSNFGSFYYTYGFMILRPGVLTKGSWYNYQLESVDQDSKTGLSSVILYVRAGVTSCSVSFKSLNEVTLATEDDGYTVLDTVTITTTGCVTDIGYPLTYQVASCVDSECTKTRFLGSPRSSASLSFTGPDPVDSGVATFYVKVCNTYGDCSWNEKTVTVTAKTVFSAEEEAAFLGGVNVKKATGKFGPAFSDLSTFNSVGSSRRKRSAEERSLVRMRRGFADATTSSMTDMLDILQSFIDSTVLDSDSVTPVIEQTTSFIVDDISLEDQSTLLGYLVTLSAVFVTEEKEMSSTAAEALLEVSGDIASGLDTQFHSSQLENVNTISSNVIKSNSFGTILGGDATEITGTGSTSKVLKAIPSGSYSSKSSGNSISVDFGSDIENSYGAAWNCSSSVTGTCSGVTLQFEHYDTDTDYVSTSADDISNRTGDIISISLADPESGSEITVTDIIDPISLTFPVTISKEGVSHECRFYNVTSSQWSTEGMDTYSQTDSSATCHAYHLSSFSIFAVESPTTTSGITTLFTTILSTTISTIRQDPTVETKSENIKIYILLGVFFGVVIIFIFGIGFFLCFKCFFNRSKNMKVSSSDLHEENSSRKNVKPGTSQSKVNSSINSRNWPSISLVSEEEVRPLPNMAVIQEQSRVGRPGRRTPEAWVENKPVTKRSSPNSRTSLESI